MVKTFFVLLLILPSFFSPINGEAQANQAFQLPSSSKIPTVELAELARHFSKYKNQEVRVRAVYHSWFEGSEFSQAANGWEGTGLIWVDFSDTVKSQLSPDVAQRLKKIQFRPQLEGNGMYYDWQTEMIVTGRMYKSSQRKFGWHGGYKYAFVVTSVEEIGALKKFDAITSKYVEP